MATWTVHFRIADYYIHELNGIDDSEFAVGSVAPDCGYGEKDSVGKFTPPPTVTHWSPTGNKRDCRYKDFMKEFLLPAKTQREYSFYLGYYIHLLTDIMWSSEMFICTKRSFTDRSEKTRDFLKKIKRDWNGLDLKYFACHSDILSYRLIEEKGEVQDYLPYYEKGQLTNQIKYIADYYKDKSKYENMNRSFTFLNADKIDNFIVTAENIINENLKSNRIARFKYDNIWSPKTIPKNAYAVNI